MILGVARHHSSFPFGFSLPGYNPYAVGPCDCSTWSTGEPVLFPTRSDLCDKHIHFSHNPRDGFVHGIIFCNLTSIEDSRARWFPLVVRFRLRKWWAFKHIFFLTQPVSVFLAKKCPEGCLSIASKGWDGQDMQSERAVLNLYLLSLSQPLTSQYLCSGIGVLLICFGNNHLAAPWSKLEISLGGSVHHLIFLCSGLVINLELFTLPACWRLPHFLWKKQQLAPIALHTWT